jgi:hypothetical protein
MLISNKLSASLVESEPKEEGNSMESQTVEISDGKFQLLIRNIYNPPNNPNFNPKPMFSNPNNNFIIGGDFNSKLIEWGSPTNNQFGHMVKEALEISPFQIAMDEDCKATHFPRTNGRPSRIDLLFVFGSALWWSEPEVGDTLGSDHATLVLDVAGQLPSREQQTKHKQRWLWDKADWKAYSKKTEALVNIPKETTVKEAITKANQIILQAAKTTIPQKRRTQTPFWTPTLQRLTDERKAAQVAFKQNATPETRTLLNKTSAMVRKASTHLRRLQWRKKVEGTQTTTQLYKLLTIIRKPASNCSGKQIWNNETAHTNEAKAKLFSTFLRHHDRTRDNTKEWKTKENGKKARIRKQRQQQNTEQDDPIMNKPILLEEIRFTQKSIQPRRAPGPDDIHPEFLTHLN